MTMKKVKTTNIQDDNFERLHETMKALETAGYRLEEMGQNIEDDDCGWFCKMVKYA